MALLLAALAGPSAMALALPPEAPPWLAAFEGLRERVDGFEVFKEETREKQALLSAEVERLAGFKGLREKVDGFEVFKAETHEKQALLSAEVERLTMQNEEQQEQIDRCKTSPPPLHHGSPTRAGGGYRAKNRRARARPSRFGGGTRPRCTPRAGTGASSRRATVIPPRRVVN